MAARDLLDAALDEPPTPPNVDPEVAVAATQDPETVADDAPAPDPEASVTD